MTDDDEPALERTRAPVCPTTVKFAGYAWISFGGLVLLNLIVYMALVYGQPRAPGATGGGQGAAAGDGHAGGQGAAAVGGVCGGLVLALFGLVFMHVGLQSIRGTAKDTLGNGIGSIIFGLLNLASGVIQAQAEHEIQAGIGFLVGIGLLAAGVLALVGRGEYKEWRDALKEQEAAKRRR
ncbi:MAG TPA: hypothetical protein VLM40_05285 [Gemmata sp.]|nr:hypothetical protein [Gemmata sp.]